MQSITTPPVGKNRGTKDTDKIKLTCLPLELTDDCARAAVIASFPASRSQDTSGATLAVDDPVLCVEGGHSVWYTFEAPGNGTVTVDTFGSDYDTVLAALTGSCGSLTVQACNDDADDFQSQISFPVTSGTTYLLEIIAYAETPGGKLVLNATFTP